MTSNGPGTSEPRRAWVPREGESGLTVDFPREGMDGINGLQVMGKIQQLVFYIASTLSRRLLGRTEEHPALDLESSGLNGAT